MGFKERFEALDNIEELLSVAAPQYQEPSRYLEELILNEKNSVLAEKRLRILEDMLAKDAEHKRSLSLERIRRTRSELLVEYDWTQLPDVPLTQEEKKQFRKYREYLRELPSSIKKGVLKEEVLTFIEWKKWIDSVRNTPGYEKFIP